MPSEEFIAFARSRMGGVEQEPSEEFKNFARSRLRDIQEPEADKPQGSSFLGGVGRSLASGAGATLAGMTGAGGYIAKKAGMVNPVEPERVFKGADAVPAGKQIDLGDDLAEFLLKEGSAGEDMARGWSRDVPQNLVNRTAAGIGSMAPYMAAGLATGSLAAVPLVGQFLRSEMETQSNAAQTFQELRKAGYDDRRAMRSAQRQEWPDRVVNAALEPFGALSNKGRLVRAGAEAVQEGVLQEPGQGITQAAAMRSADGSYGDFARALWDETKRYPKYFAEVGVPAMIAGGLMGAVSPGLGRKKDGTETARPHAAEGQEVFRGGDGVEMMADSRPQVGDVFVDEAGMRHTVLKTGKDGLALEAATGKKSGMRYRDFESRGFRRLSPDEVSSGVGVPSLEGVFGPSYQEYEGKPIAAAAKVLKEKTGEVRRAFLDPEGEPLDFIYGKPGKEGFGLAHIAEKHGKKIIVRLPQIVGGGKKIVAPDHRVLYVLGDEMVTVRENWDNQKKRWLVTAYDKSDPSNFKKNDPFSYGRTSDVDQFSPRDDSPSGLNGIIEERLSNNSDNVNVEALSSASRAGFEPRMPEGTLDSKRKISEIRSIIEDAVGIPVRERQVRVKNALGYIDHLHEVIRSKSYNDVSTLLHEFGHAVDKRFKLSESFPEAYAELAAFGKAMGYKPHQWQSEGLAQFFQWRGIDPKQAYEMFPEYSKVFDGFIGSTPEAKAMVDRVFGAAYEYYHSTPEARLGAVIADEVKRKPTLSERWGSVRQQFLDRQAPFTKINEFVADRMGVDKRMLPDKVNLEAAARTMPGTQAVVNEKVDSFMKKFAGFTPEEYEQMRRYMVAGGAEDYFRNGMNPGVGLTVEELAGIRSRTPEKLVHAAEAMRADYDAMMRDTLVRSGIVSQRMFDEWKKRYPNYVPMIADDGNGGFSVLSPQQARNMGYVSLEQPVKGRRGVKYERDVVMRRDPVRVMLENYKRFHDLAARNDVGKVLVNISKMPGMARVAEKVPNMGRNSFYVWEGGKRRFYATDPEIYAALRSLGEAGVSGNPVLKFAHQVSEVFKAGTTRFNPWFIIKNFVRDSFTTSVQSSSKWNDPKNLPFVNTFDGIMQMVGADKQLVREAMEDGVFYSSMVEMNRANIPRLIERNLSGGQLRESLKRLEAIAGKVGSWNEIVEVAPKLREYKVLREQGIPRKQAAMEAREVNTDFQRAGLVGRIANQYVPFLNAQVQGLDKASRMFKEHPAESMVKAGLYIMLPSLLEWAMYHDDDAYKGLDKQIKDTHWVFRLPGAAPDDFVRVPMPFEIGVLFGGGTKRALDKVFEKDPAAGYRFIGSLNDAIVPDLSLALLRPWMEVWANKDSFRDRPIVPLREQQLPARLQYGSSTSYPAKLAGSLGVSPRKVDHLIRGYGGTMAGQAAHLFDVFDRGRAPAVARNWHESALVRPYTISSDSSNHYISRFYDVAEELDREMKGARQERSAIPNGGLAQLMSGRRSALSRIWKRIGEVKDARGMSPEAKKAEIDRLNARAVKIAKMSLDVYDRRMRGK